MGKPKEGILCVSRALRQPTDKTPDEGTALADVDRLKAHEEDSFLIDPGHGEADELVKPGTHLVQVE